jgi:NAD(P)-dependent dehydrogenase (short-subunit alcohol dehydrogenase family)
VRAELDAAVVVVTGGASGLGRAVVDALVRRGATVSVLDRRTPLAEVHHVAVDLADTAAAGEAVRAVRSHHGRIDAVVTCAGIDVPGRLDEVPTPDWERVVAVNLLGTAAVIRSALPSLTVTGGHVVTVASTLGHRAVSDATAYCASKFGVVGFTRALAAELRGEVGVTLLTPGGMDTAFFDERDEQYRPPAGVALAPPAAVADAVLYALSAPAGVELKELVVTRPAEDSWP